MSEPRDEGRSTFSLLFRSPLVFSALCPLSLPVMSLFLGVIWSPDRVRLWHLLMACQPGLWLASVLIVLNDYRRHRQDWPGGRSERRAVVLCTLLAWAMNSLPLLVQLITRRWALHLDVDVDALLQMPHLHPKLFILGMLAAAVATLHTAGMLSVHVQLLAYPREPASRAEALQARGLDEDVLRYQRLRSRLERFLVLSAVTIGTETLGIGAFRNLLGELVPSKVFEPSRIMGYGIYSTVLLASVYLPARRTLTEVGEGLVARYARQFPAEGTSWKDWSQEQQAVRTWLGLQSSTLQDFQQGLSVLAPLLASLSSVAFGAGG